MKVQTAAVNEIERFDIGTDRAFSIKFDAKMASILADGLYSNKIKSVIRELSCNAYDSHVEAGKGDIPFEVHLPNNLEPWFHVKDFGVGLSDKQILDIYTCYGVSTKTDSNAVIGQLGLGSKSPFSLTSAFNVTARKDGIENHYSMYKDEMGMPSVAHLGSNATTECNGVTVKVPVRTDQRGEFIYNAGDVFKWFPVKPTIVGASKHELETINSASELKVKFEGNDWALVGGYRTTSFAVMGTVAYPLNTKNIIGATAQHRLVLEAGIILKFNIGDFEVAANREAIGYDERTCINICAKLDNLINELGIQLQAKISSAKTEWEAQKLYNDIYRTGSYSDYTGTVIKNLYTSKVTWKTIQLSGYKTFDRSDFCEKDPATDKFVTNIGRIKPGAKRASYMNLETELHIECSNRTVIIFNDLENAGGITRIYNRYRNANVPYDALHPRDEDIFIFNPNASLSWNEMKAKLGNPKVIFTSSLPKVEVKRTVSKVLSWVDWGRSRGMRDWQETTVDLDKGGYFVDLNGWNVKVINSYINSEVFSNIIRESKNADILTGKIEIYAMRGSLKSQVKANPKWIDVTVYIRDAVEKMAVSGMAQEIVDHDSYLKIIYQDNIWNAWEHNLKINDPTSPMLSFIDIVRTIRNQTKKLSSYKSSAMNYLCGKFNVKIDANATPTLANKTNEIVARYPMLTILKRCVLNEYDIKKVTDYINFIDATDVEFRKEVQNVA